MDIKKQNKFLTWAVIILIISNITTITGLWFTQSTINKNATLNIENNTKTQDQCKHPKLFDQLNLSEEQSQQIKKLRNEHFTQMRVIKDSIYNAKEKIHHQIFSENPNIQYINQLSDSIGILNAEFEKLNNIHFLKVKTYLDIEQQQKLGKLIEDASFGENARKHQHRNHDKE